MKNLEITNEISGVKHIISFKSRPASGGKIVITLDGRSIGKINRKSKAVFCDREDVYNEVVKNIDSVLSEN